MLESRENISFWKELKLSTMEMLLHLWRSFFQLKKIKKFCAFVIAYCAAVITYYHRLANYKEHTFVNYSSGGWEDQDARNGILQQLSCWDIPRQRVEEHPGSALRLLRTDSHHWEYWFIYEARVLCPNHYLPVLPPNTVTISIEVQHGLCSRQSTQSDLIEVKSRKFVVL